MISQKYKKSAKSMTLRFSIFNFLKPNESESFRNSLSDLSGPFG